MSVNVDVIASYENHPQEWFSIYVPSAYLDNHKDMIDFITQQLENPISELYKISLCWVCDEKSVNTYRAIKDSINLGGKYYFENGLLEEIA